MTAGHHELLRQAEILSHFVFQISDTVFPTNITLALVAEQRIKGKHVLVLDTIFLSVSKLQVEKDCFTVFIKRLSATRFIMIITRADFDVLHKFKLASCPVTVAHVLQKKGSSYSKHFQSVHHIIDARWSWLLLQYLLIDSVFQSCWPKPGPQYPSNFTFYIYIKNIAALENLSKS